MRGEGAAAHIVDVGAHPVINPRAFDTMTLRDEPVKVPIGGAQVTMVGASDLVTLKLAAGRDHDIVGVMLLAAHAKPSAAAVARNAELDDNARSLASAASATRVAVERGHTSMLAVELLGRPPTAAEVAARAAARAAGGGTMTPHRYVVLTQRVRGFDTRQKAEAYALANYPAVVCERVREADGTENLVEVVRHDFLYDEERGRWRVMLG